MDTWADALHAAALMAVDPAGTGALVRAHAGPVRDAWLAALAQALPAPPRRVPLSIRDDRLLGGLDLPATLRAGRPVAQRGLLAEADGGVLVLPMAERAAPELAARVCAALDRGEVAVERDGIARRDPARFGLVVLDESVAEDEGVSAALADRVAFMLDLRTVAPREAAPPADPAGWAAEVARARERLPHVRCPEAVLEALCQAASALGIASLRAPLLALRVARAAAALDGRDTVDAEDAGVAARLVLGPRATQRPAANDEQAEPPAPPPAEGEAPPEAEDPAAQAQGPLDDVVLAAALATLPPDLLARMALEQGPRQRAGGSGQGAVRAAGRRGRPAGVRRGEPRAGERLNLVDTLRAAAPWQRVRGAVPPRVQVRAEDFHVTRHRERRETTAIFVVDASGSAALHRLAEAKGAVELLLADCYVRRDKVAVIGFRGSGADLLLPPTRSLVRAKRSLAGLPGGGGTPLAAALEAAAALADAVRRRGDTPLVVLLTDGRANVGLDGHGGRAKAEADATTAARRLRAAGCAVLLIDTAPQPGPQAARLADALAARYLALPHAGAQAMSAVVQQAVRRAGAG